MLFLLFLLFRRGPLAVRLAVVKAALVVFLLFWPPRYESLAAAKRARRLQPATAEDAESTPKDDDAWQSGSAGRLPRQPRRRRLPRRRHLVHALITLCAVSALLVLLSVVASPVIITWHPGGWPQL